MPIFFSSKGFYVVKIMADGGQNFFKITMTILPDDSECDEDENDIAGTRSLYSEGGSCAKKSNPNSVNRLIMLCITPQIKETYENLKLLFDLININEVSFKFVSDLKVLLIINGQQTATSSYPCPFCFISLGDLRNRENFEKDNDKNRLKTYGDLMDDYESFCKTNKNMKLAKDCHSTINAPIFQEDRSAAVLHKCIIPELHIMQGFVNHFFWDGLVPLLGREKALIWPEKLKLVSKRYQGEIFEGNACRILLKNADALYDPEIYENICPMKLIPFVSAFKSMDKVVHSFFAVKASNLSNITGLIRDLQKDFIATEVSKTLKMHILLDHLEEGISSLGGKGLGLYSEQAGESVHREFLKYWGKYKVNKIDDPQYISRLKRAVVEFSSKHA